VAETDPDFDKTCIDHPEELLATDCNKNYCTIIRQEYKVSRVITVDSILTRTCTG
jgi:hypothetical protein